MTPGSHPLTSNRKICRVGGVWSKMEVEPQFFACTRLHKKAYTTNRKMSNNTITQLSARTEHSAPNLTQCCRFNSNKLYLSTKSRAIKIKITHTHTPLSRLPSRSINQSPWSNDQCTAPLRLVFDLPASRSGPHAQSCPWIRKVWCGGGVSD